MYLGKWSQLVVLQTNMITVIEWHCSSSRYIRITKWPTLDFNFVFLFSFSKALFYYRYKFLDICGVVPVRRANFQNSPGTVYTDPHSVYCIQMQPSPPPFQLLYSLMTKFLLKPSFTRSKHPRWGQTVQSSLNSCPGANVERGGGGGTPSPLISTQCPR